MATSVLADATDAIPLLDETVPGNGQYFKGRNNAQDIRRQLIGAITAKNNGAYVIRPGVFVPSSLNTTSQVYVPLQVNPLASPGQGVQLFQGRAIQERGSTGPYLISLDGTLTSVNMPAADASNPRWDVIYLYNYDKSAFPADGFHGPKYVVETGTPAASPTVPTIPTDAIKLAEVYRRTSGDTPSGNVINTADIVDKRKGTTLQGTPRMMLPGDALSDAGGYHGEVRLRAGSFVPTSIANLGVKVLYDYWDAVGATWRGTQTIVWPRPTITPVTFMLSNTTHTLASVAIPDPGWPYYVTASASARPTIPTPGAENDTVGGIYLSTVLDEASITPTPSTRIIHLARRPQGIPEPVQLHCPLTAHRTLQTGAHTVYLLVRNETYPIGRFVDVADDAYAAFHVEITPA